MAEVILKKIPVEKRWEIAAKSFTGTSVGYYQVLLPIIGKEKLDEIGVKMWGESGKTFLQPECEFERIEETKERVVERWTKCPVWERAKEFGITEQYDCFPSCSAYREGLKAIDPKLTCKITKALPHGDPYCEFVYELKE